MTRSTRALCCAYLLAAVLIAHSAVTTARHGAPWYAAGLAAVQLLLIAAFIREYLAADERRAAKVKAERAARVRDRAEQQAIRQAAEALGHACCERWWTSCGFHHDSTCKNQRRTV